MILNRPFIILICLMLVVFHMDVLLFHYLVTDENTFRQGSGHIAPIHPSTITDHTLTSNHTLDTTSTNEPKIQQILQNAGVDLTQDVLQQLPSWNYIASIYGRTPKIIGLESCETYRKAVAVRDVRIGPSGMFNSGTNLLAEVLEENCHIPMDSWGGKAKKPMLWQVPWGKHNPASWRTHNIAKAGGAGVNQLDVLPIIIIKDPYNWMNSMCRHSYAANWNHSKTHCPNLVTHESELFHKLVGYHHANHTNRVTVHYKPQNRTFHDSLVGLWNDWYGDYKAITHYPRLMIRYEDLLFHLQEVVTKVCHCGGGKIIHANGTVSIQSDSAKGSKGAHEGANGLLSAVMQYGNSETRVKGFSVGDLEYAETMLRSDLMEEFGYKYHLVT